MKEINGGHTGKKEEGGSEEIKIKTRKIGRKGRRKGRKEGRTGRLRRGRKYW